MFLVSRAYSRQKCGTGKYLKTSITAVRLLQIKFLSNDYLFGCLYAAINEPLLFWVGVGVGVAGEGGGTVET